MKPRICILTSQYFGWGIYGGFGSMSRQLAESLQQAGYEIIVIVPRRHGQQPIEMIASVKVMSFSAFNIREAINLLQTVQVDIFHSQDPTFLTYLAQQLRPRCKHIVTCRDPRDLHDWWVEFQFATTQRRMRMPFHLMTESGPFVYLGVRHASNVFCPAHFLRSKVQRMYQLRISPDFLPNLIDLPDKPPVKSSKPTFVYLARFDKRKRPWVFFELAHRFPAYRFIAVGQGSASAENDYDKQLRQEYGNIPNLEMTGLINRFTDPEKMTRILSDSWALISTAAREGLPLSFLEAAAHGCAIISGVNPDEFATRFGEWAVDDNFPEALQRLINSSPVEKGKRARRYVAENYERNHALGAHLQVYHQLVG